MSREVTIKDGEITLDKQRVVIFPMSFIALYSLRQKNNLDAQKKFYDTIKSGMIEFSKPLGKEYSLSYRDFLDRWVKFTAFAGWGIVQYQVVDQEKTHGFLTIKNFPQHMYLKEKGIKEPSDPLMEGMIAGSLSGTFKKDIDAIETSCVCSGSEVCTYYWGPLEFLRTKFPELTAKRFGVR